MFLCRNLSPGHIKKLLPRPKLKLNYDCWKACEKLEWIIRVEETIFVWCWSVLKTLRRSFILKFRILELKRVFLDSKNALSCGQGQTSNLHLTGKKFCGRNCYWLFVKAKNIHAQDCIPLSFSPGERHKTSLNDIVSFEISPSPLVLWPSEYWSSIDV